MNQTSSADSRLIKREKKKLFKQTLLAVSLALGLFLIFIFWGLPNAPRILGLIVGSDDGGIQTNEFPPQTPSLYISERYVNQASIEIQGSGLADSWVVIELNGQELVPIQIGADGSFKSQLELSEGDNLVSAYAYYDKANPSAASLDQIIMLDTTPPDLTFTDGINPDMNVVGKDKQYLMIAGQTESGAKVNINDRFLFAKESGEFAYRYRLSEGANSVKILIEDKAGNTKEAELKINFKP